MQNHEMIGAEVISCGPGLHLLEVLRPDAAFPLLPLLIARGNGPARLVHVPALRKTSYLLRVRRMGARLAVPPGVSATLCGHRFGLQDLRHLVWLRKSDRKARLDLGGDLSLRALLAAEGREGRELKKSLSILRKFGFPLSSANFQSTPGLFEAWKPEPHQPSVVAGGAPRFAVALHLYYRDLWDEFEFALRRLTQPFHLIVTVSEHDPDFEARVRHAFPSAEIHVFENRGRDVGPFVELLRLGRFDGFEFVCKLHGKRSGVSGPRVLLGHVWRRANLIDLLGSAAQADAILAEFEANPSVGMIGSSRFRFPNASFDEVGAWGANRNQILALAERAGVPGKDVMLDYFAGTMFWLHRKPLEALRAMKLSLADFPPEEGAADGRLEHAMERLFGLLPRAVGMTLADAPPARGGNLPGTEAQ